MNVHFSSLTDMWATPQAFFDSLDREFEFTLDPCATKDNAKCSRFFTADDDGLAHSWDGEHVFCNPPYGRVMPAWVKKASEARGGVVVLLIPARTDTRYFHQYIYKNERAEIRFIKGRLKFGGSKNSAPFPSMVVIFKGV